MTKLFLSLLLLVFTTACLAQNDSIQNLYFFKKNREVVFDKRDYQPGKKAFYIYRNCVYDLVLKNKKEIQVRVIDIKNDSIYYTLYMNSPGKTANDTISLHPGGIKKIRMIGDRTMGLFKSYSLRKCRYHFVKSEQVRTFEQRRDTVYNRDSSIAGVYEVVPYLTAQGLDMLYQQCGNTYYYEGISQPECEDTTKKSKPPLVKKGVWFTPSNANIIKGVNVGLVTMHLEDEPLTISGVNLNADALSVFLGFYSLMYLGRGNTLINMEDTVDKSKMNNLVKGLSLSVGGLMGNDMSVKGVSINGGICGATEAKGLMITGTQNFTNDFSGLMITGLRNLAIKGKGVQVGLLNICKHLKGVQFGLWNVNSKRRLPLINWSF